MRLQVRFLWRARMLIKTTWVARSGNAGVEDNCCFHEVVGTMCRNVRVYQCICMFICATNICFPFHTRWTCAYVHLRPRAFGCNCLHYVRVANAHVYVYMCDSTASVRARPVSDLSPAFLRSFSGRSPAFLRSFSRHVHECPSVCLSLSVWVHEWLHACVQLCVYVCVHVNIKAPIWHCMLAYTYSCMHVDMCVCVTCWNACMYACICKCMCGRLCMHAICECILYVHECRWTCMYVEMSVDVWM